jgi:hypothetical protein
MAQIAADILSAVQPRDVAVLGLDTTHALVRDAIELEDFKRLARTLKTRGFKKLRKIRVRLDYHKPKYDSRETFQILRGIFPKKLLTVENLPYERRHVVRDVTDDCYWSVC